MVHEEWDVVFMCVRCLVKKPCRGPDDKNETKRKMGIQKSKRKRRYEKLDTERNRKKRRPAVPNPSSFGQTKEETFSKFSIEKIETKGEKKNQETRRPRNISLKNSL
jgi:hypothetical protein